MSDYLPIGVYSKQIDIAKHLDYSDRYVFTLEFDSDCCPEEVWEWLSLIHGQMMRLMNE